MRAGQIADIAGELDHGALHAEADSQKWNPLLSRVADGGDFPLDAPFAESARHQDTVVAGQPPLRSLRFHVLAADATDADLRAVSHSGVVQRFVDRLVGVV